MRTLGTLVAAALVLTLATGLSMAQAPASSPLDTGFTYQGRLKSSDTPYTGICDFQFALWDALSGGTQAGSTLTTAGVKLSEGLFTVQLDFGAGRFQGDARWLEIAVRCPAGSGLYTRLSPRQPLTAAPAALSLALPFRAEGSAVGPLVSITNDGAGEGLAVESASGTGVHVASSGISGVYVGSAGTDGVHVYEAGSPSQHLADTGKNGFEVEGAQNCGLFVGHANAYGVRIQSAGGDGVHVETVGGDGLEVVSASYGVTVGTAGNAGMHVASANYGLWVNSANNNGVHVYQAAADGLYVYESGGNGLGVAWADGNGVYANTTRTSHEWGIYTPDKIYAGSFAGGGPSMIVAQAAEGLEPGDLAAVAGLGAPFGESEFPAPLVRRAAPGASLAGVVVARFVVEEQAEEVELDGRVETHTSLDSHTTEGPVAPGEYLLLVVLGQAQVKASALAGGIAAGDLLAVGADGQATALGSAGYVPGSLVGTAMQGLDAAAGSGLIWVLVTPR